MRITPVVVILIVLCTGSGIAEVKRPKTNAPEKTENNKTQTPQGKTNQPFASVTSRQPHPQNPANAPNDKTVEERNINIQERIANYTKWLAVLAAFQFLAMFVQAIFLRKTLGATKEAADAAKKSAEVAENALILLDRPYVFVFGVREFHLDPDNLELSVDYEVANFGKTPAIIERAHFVLENIKSNLNAPLEVDRRHSLVIAPILGAGEIRKDLAEDVPINILNYTTTNNGKFSPALNHGDDIFFRALVYYRGSFTKGHVSSYCWRYNTYTAHFEPYGHEDYNYTT
jgi:hypothetical protein